MFQSISRITIIPALLCTLIVADASAQGGGATPIGPLQGISPQTQVWQDISPGWLPISSPVKITFQPGSPQRILLGTTTEGLCDSFDHGATWHQRYDDFYIADNIPSCWITDVAFNPSDSQEALAVTMSGTYWSVDGGIHWYRHSTNMQPTATYQLALSPDGNYAMATELFGSLFRYDWSSRDWDNELVVHYGVGLYALSFDQSTPPKLYFGSGSTLMAVSPDMGLSSYGFGQGLSGTAMAVAADPEVAGRVLAASGPNLFIKHEAKSRAQVWFPYGSGLPGTDINVLIHDPRNPDRIFAGTDDNGVYVSLDRGLTWKPMTQNGLGYLTVVDLAINPEKPLFLLASAHNGISPTSGGGLFRIWIR